MPVFTLHSTDVTSDRDYEIAPIDTKTLMTNVLVAQGRKEVTIDLYPWEEGLSGMIQKNEFMCPEAILKGCSVFVYAIQDIRLHDVGFVSHVSLEANGSELAGVNVKEGEEEIELVATRRDDCLLVSPDAIMFCELRFKIRPRDVTDIRSRSVRLSFEMLCPLLQPLGPVGEKVPMVSDSNFHGFTFYSSRPDGRYLVYGGGCIGIKDDLPAPTPLKKSIAVHPTEDPTVAVIKVQSEEGGDPAKSLPKELILEADRFEGYYVRTLSVATADLARVKELLEASGVEILVVEARKHHTPSQREEMLEKSNLAADVAYASYLKMTGQPKPSEGPVAAAWGLVEPLGAMTLF